MWDEWDTDTYHQTKIRPSFAQYTNPRLPFSNSAVFEEMVQVAGIRKREFSLYNSYSEEDLETVLGLIIVNGMARANTGVVAQGDLEGWQYNGSHTSNWWRDFLPKGRFGPGGNTFNASSEGMVGNYTFQVDVLVIGYGFSFWKGRSMKVAIIILLIQSSIAVAYILWSVLSGASSTSHDSFTELVALALASQEPENRRGLATGEASIASLTQRYCVVADGYRL